jgi:Asp-tRNA(Asn)/Glu-tRNA(Gln) amidotransferase A subunit family amidase
VIHSTLHSTDDLVAIAKSLRSGELDLSEYIHRLEETFEAREPEIHAFLPEAGRFARLQRQAEELLGAYPEPGKRPAMFGIAVGVKDIFHVDGFATHGGSRLPQDRLAGSEAAIVSRLKALGALILGKTVTTEFAYFAPGPTRNPRHLEHTPGGSSSGSAAAVADGMLPLALGTQTIGSIIRPAAFCGVVGFKPTRDRIARDGVIPLAPSLDHIGFFTVDASGAELAASWTLDDWSAEHSTVVDRPVLGVPDGPYLARATPEGLAQFELTCTRLQAAGYPILRVPAMADFEEIYQRHMLILAAEAAQVHADWYREFSHLYHAKTAELIERGRSVPPRTLSHALEGCRALRETMTALMDSHGLDAWIAPSAPGPAPAGLGSTGDPVMNLPWTHSGLPALNLPSGTTPDGLPFGTQIVGRWRNDEALLAFGKMLERDLMAHRAGEA